MVSNFCCEQMFVICTRNLKSTNPVKNEHEILDSIQHNLLRHFDIFSFWITIIGETPMSYFEILSIGEECFEMNSLKSFQGEKYRELFKLNTK